MAISQRERWIAFAVGGAIALAGLDYFILDPFLTDIKDARAAKATAEKTLHDQNEVIRRRAQLIPVWNEMRAGGMQSTFDAATQQAISALNAWAADSGLRLTSSYPDAPQEVRPTAAGAASPAPARPGQAPKAGPPDVKFYQIAVHATGEGSIAAIAKLLWRVETSSIPMRVNDITITPLREEGTDNLKVQLNVSTLSVQGELDVGRSRATTVPADAKGARS